MPAEAVRPRGPVADPALLTHWMIIGMVTLPGQPEHVRAARKFVAQTVGKSHPQADTAILLTSELVANAVTHSRSRLPGGTVDVVVAARPSALLISVTDGGSESSKPVLSTSPGAEHGNGLLLVATLAQAWGYLRYPGGTMVWFRLASALPSQPDPGADHQEDDQPPVVADEPAAIAAA